MTRSLSARTSIVVLSALFVHGLLVVGRYFVADGARQKLDRGLERSSGSRRRSRARSRELVRTRPALRPHHAVDLRPKAQPEPDRDERAERTTPARRWRVALALIALGATLAVYTAAVALWRDPVTDLYARWQQGKMADSLGATFAQFDGPVLPDAARLRLPDGSRSRASSAYAVDPDAYASAESVAVAGAARRMMNGIELGQPIGRIHIPRLSVNAVFIHGTRWGPDLSKGPGHYKETPLPGVGKTAAIAAHRTTFGAWFRHIDDLRRGDRITISLPYATFQYMVFTHKIVDDEDWSIIENRGFDALVLSACHPLYSAAQRWVVFARAISVKPRGGEPYAVTAKGGPAALQKT